MTSSTMDPVAAWDTEVAALMRGGLTKAAAVRQLATSNPQLHQAYLGAFNSRHQAARVDRSQAAESLPSSSQAFPRADCHGRQFAESPPAASGDAIAEWDAAVAAEMRRSGCSKANATRAVAIAQPDLQRQYVAAYEAKYGDAVRSRERQKK